MPSFQNNYLYTMIVVLIIQKFKDFSIDDILIILSLQSVTKSNHLANYYPHLKFLLINKQKVSISWVKAIYLIVSKLSEKNIHFSEIY